MSKIEVNTVEPQCGTNLTIGASGDTITFPSGTTVVNNGSQTGFGRTGTVDWQTGSIKTTTFTAVNGEGYFVNTSGGAVTANLPAGSAGAIVSFADYTRTFQTNNLTITPNGSEKIGGVAANFVAQTEGQSITLVYVDATEGWINTAESTGQSGLIPAFITATGGTITCSGDYKIHTFTGPGTFTVTCAGNPLGSSAVDYLVLAGGGGGGPSFPSVGGGGGGAGGFRESHSTPVSGSYTASPLATPTGITVTATAFPITVGGGGAVVTQGANSVFSTITSTGGGGGRANNPGGPGGPGGSGGGATLPGNSGGTGNTPPVSPPQGNNGGDNPGSPTETSPSAGSGGGGAGSAAAGIVSNTRGGMGAVGVITNISNSPVKYAGGGGGGGNDPGGGGGLYPLCVSGAPSALSRTSQYGAGIGGITAGGQGGNGTANTGGGAGGGGNNGDSGGTGGSGIVIIRYKFQ